LTLQDTQLSGVYEAKASPFADSRGAFARLFCQTELAKANQGRMIVQINHSRTHSIGALRGLHFQHSPHAEAKWVRCLHGRVYDVALDLRAGSTTFLQWHAVELSARTMNAVFIPEGCAHGFQVLEPDSELLYLHTATYAPGSEGGVRWDDPRPAIGWPLPVTDISARDNSHPLLTDEFAGLIV
jgi:dTDP-4-dehydrorhamnose 3,5-epimerase